MAWTYSNWVTEETATATRLSRLRLHIQEVSDALTTQKYSADGGTVRDNRTAGLTRYLESLRVEEKNEAAAVAASAGRKPLWTRGRPRSW